jgi:YHS domain-containing protein
MRHSAIAIAAILGAMMVGNWLLADDTAAPTTQPTTQAIAAIDLKNTICPVSKEAVADSNNVVVYDGKVYHLCCPDCHVAFEKNPQKFADAVKADPSKYGVK